jgi:hypothetical protein
VGVLGSCWTRFRATAAWNALSSNSVVGQKSVIMASKSMGRGRLGVHRCTDDLKFPRCTYDLTLPPATEFGVA